MKNPRVLIAPAGFKESLSAQEVTRAIARGVKAACPDVEPVELPLVDGGEGFTLTLVEATGGEKHPVQVTGPVGEPVDAHVGVLGGDGPRTGVLEMAAAAGLRLVPPDRRDPLETTTFGVGELICALLEMDVERILIGCGDSGTNDGGAGMAEALGIDLLREDGSTVERGANGLVELDRIDVSGRDPGLQTVRLDVACNLHNVLCGPDGVARVFGPQKGASPETVDRMEAALDRYAGIIERDTGQDVRTIPGGGASGGLGEEGEVVVYAFTSRIADVEVAFEEQYPEIDLIGLDIAATEQIARIQAEQEAGQFEVDVAYISDAPVVIGDLLEPGYLQAYVPPQFEDRVPAEFQEPLLANRISTKVLMYNEEAHPDGSPVTNLWELTQEEWAGRVVMVDPLVRGDYLDLMTEIVLRSDEMAAAYEELNGQPLELSEGFESAGEQWIADLFANDVILVDDTDTVNESIGATGQENPPIGFTSYSDRRDNEEEGWALQVANDVAPSPGITFPALLGIVNNAPHPAAARLLIHFMMGDDSPTGGPGYEPFYVPGDYATRTDIEPHPDAVPLDEFNAWPIDSQEIYERRDAVADLILTLQ